MFEKLFKRAPEPVDNVVPIVPTDGAYIAGLRSQIERLELSLKQEIERTNRVTVKLLNTTRERDALLAARNKRIANLRNQPKPAGSAGITASAGAN